MAAQIRADMTNVTRLSLKGAGRGLANCPRILLNDDSSP